MHQNWDTRTWTSTSLHTYLPLCDLPHTATLTPMAAACPPTALPTPTSTASRPFRHVTLDPPCLGGQPSIIPHCPSGCPASSPAIRSAQPRTRQGLALQRWRGCKLRPLRAALSQARRVVILSSVFIVCLVLHLIEPQADKSHPTSHPPSSSPCMSLRSRRQHNQPELTFDFLPPRVQNHSSRRRRCSPPPHAAGPIHNHRRSSRRWRKVRAGTPPELVVDRC